MQNVSCPHRCRCSHDRNCYEHASQQVTALGDDTDLYVVFVVVFIPHNIKLIFGLSIPKSKSRIQAYCWDIKCVQQSLGKDVCENLLFIQALSGCDTTSHVYEIGKAIPFNKIKTSSYLKSSGSCIEL